VRYVAGADEAGRGCLAGPLVAAAVLFDLERIGPREVRALSGLNDSKQQLQEKRAAVFPVILRTAAKVVIVSRCAPGIDARGLHRTNLAALRDALAKVACPGCICLSDGFPVASVGHEQMAVVGGDAKSAAIAAASVIAKETRDRYMRRADRAHPGWEFATHVGYSTPEHREAIERLGISPLHRRSFQSAAYLQLGLGLGELDLGACELDLGPGELDVGVGELLDVPPAVLDVPPEVLEEPARLEPRSAA
jgi:ribonuclease HII